MQYNITCNQYNILITCNQYINTTIFFIISRLYYNEKSRWENIKLFSEFVGDM